MPTPFDHALMALLVLGLPVRARFMFGRLQRAAAEELPRQRMRLYLQAMAIQWTLLVALLALWFALGRPLAGLGIVARTGPVFWAVLAAVIAVFAALANQVRRLDPATAARVRASFASLEAMLPHTRGERGLFYALSTTAGVCEELLYRGFLIWYFATWLSPIVAMFAVAALFGLGHAYQGLSGVVKTGIAGVVLGAVYLVTGSIVLPIVLHVLMDVHAGSLTHRVLVLTGAASEPERAPA